MFGFQPSIRQKIIFGYYAGVTVFIGLCIFTFSELWFIEKKVQFGGAVSQFFDTTLEIRRFEKNFFLYGKNEDYRESINYAVQAQVMLDSNLKEYRRLASSQQLNIIKKDLQKYRLLMEQFAQFTKQNTNQRLAMEKTIRKIGKEIVTLAEDISITERKKLQALLITLRKILVLSILILSLTGIAIGQVLSRMVVRPLKSLEDKMNEISEGKLKTASINSKDREIVSLTNAFNKMLMDLELRQKHLIQMEKLASLGTLISGVAHELNNPLSNISSSCQILTEELESPDMGYKKELLSQIDEQTERARKIVRSLLDFSRDKDFKKEKLQLKNLFEETIQFIKGEIPSRVSIKLDVREDLYIFADKQRIQQAFLNLIKNAVESVAGEGNVFITSRVHLLSGSLDERCEFQKKQGECTGECPFETDTVDIEIRDSGVGIPPDVLPKIFDPFFTTKDVGKGSGLGLYIVQEFVQEHGGCIGVLSETGKGTTFLIRFPFKE
jgi:two-component system NtrC family sensor kinase